MSCRAAMSPRQLIAVVVNHPFQRAAAAADAKRRPVFQINAGAARTQAGRRCAPQNSIVDLSRLKWLRSLRCAGKNFSVCFASFMVNKLIVS